MSKKQEIFDVFVKLKKELGRDPFMTEMNSHGITEWAIRWNYGNKEKLSQYVAGNTSIVEYKVDGIIEKQAEEAKALAEKQDAETRALIEKSYLEIFENTLEPPTYDEMGILGVSPKSVQKYYGNINSLREYIEENHMDKIRNISMPMHDIWEKTKEEPSDFKSVKRYVITTAIANFRAHDGFIKALKSYCEYNDAEILVLPCESTTNSFENKKAYFDKTFYGDEFKFVTKDVRLNKNLFVCSIQVSASQIKTTTGLSRLTKKDGSYVFAGPKQFLDFKPSGNDRGKCSSIMTTGSCTTGNYLRNTQFVSRRLSYIANHDHMIGAVIVEVEDEEHFHFRQIQADENGSFIDLGVEYSFDGSIKEVPINVVFGDIHGVAANVEAIGAFCRDFGCKNIDRIFVHDIFDGMSVSHHIETIYEKVGRVESNNDFLEKELKETFEVISSINNSLTPSGEIVIVKSNHDEFLTRYLKSGRYVNDPNNHKLALKIAIDMLDGVDVMESGFRHVVDSVDRIIIDENILFLSRDDSYKIGGVELGAHGDLGRNGAKPSLNSLEEVYGECVIGHNHTAAIQRGVFRVGTMSNLDLGYNRGPSSWTQTNCLVYENGQRQLVNYINGKYFV